MESDYPLGLEPESMVKETLDPDTYYESDLAEPRGNSWKTHRKLKEDKIVQYISLEQVLDLAKKFNNPRDKCFFILMYLTGGRVGELVRLRRRKYKKKKITIINDISGTKPKTKYIQDHKKVTYSELLPAIKRNQIDKTDIDGIPFLRIRLRNNKNKTERSKILPIPLNSSQNAPYEEMFKIVKRYVNTFTDMPEAELFPFGERRAEQIISKIGWNPHTIRSLRATHLVRYHNFSDQMLVSFMGWTDSRPAKAYIKLSFDDIARKLIK